MKNINFKAFIIENKNHSGAVKKIQLDNLMPGDVTVKVAFSSFNYKDGLAILNRTPIIKRYPMIPGSDFSGVVTESFHKRFKKGDKVVCNGWGIGEKHFGGFSQYARVNGRWLIQLPSEISLIQSMIIGAAGYTASLCVKEIIKKIKPSFKKKVLVTGSSGGVGSIAVNLLSNIGFNVTALTNKDVKYLRNLGANDIIMRDDFVYAKKPLAKERWSAIIDTVGGDILSTLLTEVKYNGVVVSTGLAKSHKLNTTVYPFILRNITLSGIDCVYASYIKRLNAWKFLLKNLDFSIIKQIANSGKLNDLRRISKEILKGNIKGRTLIRVND